jgi:hypothetical protein
MAGSIKVRSRVTYSLEAPDGTIFDGFEKGDRWMGFIKYERRGSKGDSWFIATEPHSFAHVLATVGIQIDDQTVVACSADLHPHLTSKAGSQ